MAKREAFTESKAPIVDSEGVRHLDELLHYQIELENTPATFFLATNAVETIYMNQAGPVIFGDEDSPEVTEDTVHELYAQTKLITSIAALQLVDRGLVSLDSEANIEVYLPEIRDLVVFCVYESNGEARFELPLHRITLRMLLSHQAGTIYPLSDTILNAYFEHRPHPGTINKNSHLETICHPLAFHPGTSWSYGVGLDFVGKLIERLSGLRLEDYFDRYIFRPLGLKNFTFFPTEEVKSNKMAVCVRSHDEDESISPLPGGFGVERPRRVEDVPLDFLSGGAGLYGTQKEFLAILRAILQADPTSPHRSQHPIISGTSFNELFTGCITTEAGAQALADLIAPKGIFQTAPAWDNIDHSVGFVINLKNFWGRRKAGSGCWYGEAHTHYWIDPTTGVAGICATQLLEDITRASSPDIFYQSYVEFEIELYAQLEPTSDSEESV